MKTIEEPARRIPVAAEVDVLVVGGGTAGVMAAIAAARHGAKTLIVEQYGFLGGTHTAALVSPVCPNYHPDGRPLTEGIGQEIFDRLAKQGRAEGRVNGCYNADEDWPWFDPEALKYLLDEIVEESGAKILFNTIVSDVIRDNGSIIGVIVENKGGRSALMGRQIIDASGDADVAFRAGVPIESGRLLDRLNQPSSLRFLAGNVDFDKCCTFLRKHGVKRPATPSVSYARGGGAKDLEKYFGQLLAEGLVDAEILDYFQFYSAPGRPGEISFNCPELRKFSATDGWDASRMQLEGRRKISKIMDFCQRYIPGFEASYIAYTAPMVGVRESRRIVGEYVLTEVDVLSGMKFPDAVARNNWPPDIHSPSDDEGLMFTQDSFSADYVEIPYRALVPLKVDNLLVTGRCISATFEAQAAVRISRTCHALGQAAGTAAAMACAEKITPRQLDGRAVRKALETDGLFS